MLILFNTRNPLLILLPSCQKPTADPFADEYSSLQIDHNDEHLSLEMEMGSQSASLEGDNF